MTKREILKSFMWQKMAQTDFWLVWYTLIKKVGKVCAPLLSALQYITVQCSVVHCSAVLFIAVQCSAVQWSAVQCSALQCFLCSVVQFSEKECSYVEQRESSARQLTAVQQSLAPAAVNVYTLQLSGVGLTSLHLYIYTLQWPWLESLHLYSQWL